MSLEKIHLRKLLKIFYLSNSERVSILRQDIRGEIRKATGDSEGGGDFHTPFWADVKAHVAGQLDLRAQIKSRIGKNTGRKRLYPELANGFLIWWDEKRRWRNEPYGFIPEIVKAQLKIEGIRGIIKIENILALKIGDQTHRIMYPYFSEDPSLNEEGARLGLWAMSQAFPQYAHGDLRILDTLRSASFATRDVPFKGNEGDLFAQKYKAVLAEWRKLRKEYE